MINQAGAGNGQAQQQSTPERKSVRLLLRLLQNNSPIEDYRQVQPDINLFQFVMEPWWVDSPQPILRCRPNVLALALFYRANHLIQFFFNRIDNGTRPYMDPNMTALVNFALLGDKPVDVNVVKHLLDKTIDNRNVRASYRNTLPCALRSGNMEMITLIFHKLQLIYPGLEEAELLRQCMQCDQTLQSPLGLAIWSKNVEAVKWVLNIEGRAAETPVLKCPYLKTPLLAACRHPIAPVMRLILDTIPKIDEMMKLPWDKTADEMPNQVVLTKKDEPRKETPLIAFMRKVEYENLDKDLVDMIFGLDWSKRINWVDASGRTALHWAVDRMLLPCIRKLCEIPGIQVMLFDVLHRTPVQSAVKNCSMEILEILLDMEGYDIENDVDSFGRSLLHVAVKEDWEEGVRFLLAHESGRVLAQKPDRSGIVPAVLAAIYGCRKALKVFLCHEDREIVQSVAIPCKLTGWTIIHYAANCRKPKVMQMLLEVNYLLELLGRPLFPKETSPLDARAGPPLHQSTPLILAVTNYDIKCVQLLLAFGAKPSLGREKMGDAGKSHFPARVLDLAEKGTINLVEEIYNKPTLEEASGLFAAMYPIT